MQNRSRSKRNVHRRGMAAAVAAALVTSLSFVGISGTPVSAEIDTVERVATPSPMHSNLLSNVSCVSASFCMATGSSMGEMSAGPPEQAPIALTWNGSAWSTVPGVESTFRIVDVACASTTFCVLIGTAWAEYQPYSARHWNGTALTTVALPDGVVGFLSAVTCTSATFCLAVGQSSSTPAQTLVLKWNGTAWSRETSPNATSTFAQQLSDISCDVGGRCVAVGQVTLTETQNGCCISRTYGGTLFERTPIGSWSQPSGRSDSLAGLRTVSCLPGNSGACVTWSNSDSAMSPGSASALVFDVSAGVGASRWSNLPLPFIDNGMGHSAVNLNRIQCTSATRCIAMGLVFLWPAPGTSYIGIWNGTSWTRVTSPNAVGNTNMMDFACPVAERCLAVGSGRPGTEMSDMRNDTWSWHVRDAALTGGSGTTAPATTVAPTTTAAPTTTVAVSSQATTPATTAPATTTTAPVLQRAAASTAPAVAPPAVSTVRALPAASTPIVADASISKGEKVKVSYGGFTPFEYVQLIVASTPRVIGSGYANSKGVVTLEGDLPASLASGSHTLAVFAPASGTGYRQAIVVSAGSLPATGTNLLDGTVPAAFVLLMLGGGFLAVSRRRTALRRR